MDSDGQDSSVLYKQLIEEKMKRNEELDEQSDCKEKRKLELSILQVI